MRMTTHLKILIIEHLQSKFVEKEKMLFKHLPLHSLLFPSSCMFLNKINHALYRWRQPFISMISHIGR